MRRIASAAVLVLLTLPAAADDLDSRIAAERVTVKQAAQEAYSAIGEYIGFGQKCVKAPEDRSMLKAVEMSLEGSFSPDELVDLQRTYDSARKGYKAGRCDRGEMDRLAQAMEATTTKVGSLAMELKGLVIQQKVRADMSSGPMRLGPVQTK